MYNFVLCTALGAELFIVEKNKWTCSHKYELARIIILIVSIISTFSTTGFIFLTLCGTICFIRNSNRFHLARYLKQHHKLFFVAISLVLFIIIITKFISPNGRGSFNVRMDHLLACVKVFLKSPIYGCGWGNSQPIYNYMLYKQGLSIGLVSFMAFGGILLSSIIFIPIILDLQDLTTLKCSKEKTNIVIFELLFLMLFFFTIVNSYPILWFL